MSLTTTSTADLIKIGRKLGLGTLDVFSVLDLPRGGLKRSTIFNADDKQRGGTHWTCCYMGRDLIVYYDPFGVRPDDRVASLLKKKGKKVMWISTQSQELKASSCGYWCLFFLYMMHNRYAVSHFLAMLDPVDQQKNEQMLVDFFRG